MKKVLFSVAVFATIGALALTQSCKKKVNCTDAATAVSTAASAYLTNPTGGCAAYKTALQDFIDDCGGDNAAVKTQYEALIMDLTC